MCQEARRLHHLQVVVQRPSYGCHQDSTSEVQSPVNSTCPARSPTSTAIVKEEMDYGTDDFKSLLQNNQSLVDVLSTAMMFQANVFLKVGSNESLIISAFFFLLNFWLGVAIYLRNFLHFFVYFWKRALESQMKLNSHQIKFGQKEAYVELKKRETDCAMKEILFALNL